MGQGLQEPQGMSRSTLTFSGFYLQSTTSPISLKILIKMVTKPFLSLPISNQTTLLPHICSCPAWNHILSSGSWCWRGMMKKQRLFVKSSIVSVSSSHKGRDELWDHTLSLLLSITEECSLPQEKNKEFNPDNEFLPSTMREFLFNQRPSANFSWVGSVTCIN